MSATTTPADTGSSTRLLDFLTSLPTVGQTSALRAMETTRMFDGPTPEQTARAANVKTKKGLRAESLALWVLTGDGVAAQAAKAPKPAKAPSAPRKPRASKYPDDIREAVQRVYELMGKSHGPGPKQHVNVRKAIGDRDPVKATGFASLAKLTAFAKGDSGKLNEQPEKAREGMAQLFEASGKDPFARGKHLACIVVAYAEQLKKAK